LISSLAGAVFGYYGGISASGGNFSIPTIIAGSRSENSSSGSSVANDSSTVVNIVKKYSPAVVSIVATKDLPIIEKQYVNPFQDFCNDPFFSQFFGGCDIQVPQYQQKGTQKQEVSAGTGFLVRADGMILTNRHVVDVSGADYTVITTDGKKYPAKVLDRDPLQDLAVIKIEGTNFPTVKLGDSDKLDVGQTVLAIGNALGQFSNSVSKGIISGLSRSITASSGNSSEKLDKVIQTDAAINPGNSGGPLINLNGEVVGVNTAMATGAQSIGFALPINRAKKDIDDVATRGKITYPYLGVRYVMVDSSVQSKNNLPVDYGALVANGQNASDVAVIPGSPAAKAGIKEGDVILEIDGKKINQSYTLSDAIQSKKVGDTIKIKILSDNSKQTTLDVLLEENKNS